MKRKIQTYVSILVITAVLMMLSVSMAAATSGDFSYTVTDGEATITGYSGSEVRLTIPSEIDGYPVTAIGESAFASTGLLTVTIPGSVKIIKHDAFHLCPYLYEVNFNEGLETIESSAFGKCFSLKTVILPEGLKTVESMAFHTPLSIIKIPHSVTTYGFFDFYPEYNPDLIVIGCAGSLAEKDAIDRGITFATIPCKNHLFVKGECSCCHALLGDIDKDGDRDMDDLDLLTSYVEGTAVCPDTEIADMNQDKVLDIVDENLLMRLLLGQDIWA